MAGSYIAEWDSHNYRVKLFRCPITVGQPREYNLVAIDSGNVRRVDLPLRPDVRDGAESLIPVDHLWLLDGAPRQAWRILRRFAPAERHVYASPSYNHRCFACRRPISTGDRVFTLAQYYESLPRCPDCGRIMEAAFCLWCNDDPFGGG